MSSDPSKDNSLKRAHSPSSSSNGDGDHKRLRENHTEPEIIGDKPGTSTTSDNIINQGTSTTSDINKQGTSATSYNILNQGTSATSDNIDNQGTSTTSDNINNQGTSATSVNSANLDNSTASINGPKRAENAADQLDIARLPFSIDNLLKVSQQQNNVPFNQARNSTESLGQHINNFVPGNSTNNFRFPSNFQDGSDFNFSGFQRTNFPAMQPVHPQQLTSALNSLQANHTNLQQWIPIPPVQTFDWSNLHMPLYRPQHTRPPVPYLAPTQTHPQLLGHIPPEEMPFLTLPMNDNAQELTPFLARKRMQESKHHLELAHQNFKDEISRICQQADKKVVTMASRDYMTLVNQLERRRQEALRVSNEPLIHLLYDQQRLEAIKKTRERLLELAANPHNGNQQSNLTPASSTSELSAAAQSAQGTPNTGPSTSEPSTSGPSTSGISTSATSTPGTSTPRLATATSSSNPRPTKARRYTKEVQDILFDWYMKHINSPYISDADIADVANRSGLTMEQVRKWLRNRRHREGTGNKK